MNKYLRIGIVALAVSAIGYRLGDRLFSVAAVQESKPKVLKTEGTKLLAGKVMVDEEGLPLPPAQLQQLVKLVLTSPKLMDVRLPTDAEKCKDPFIWQDLEADILTTRLAKGEQKWVEWNLHIMLPSCDGNRFECSIPLKTNGTGDSLFLDLNSELMASRWWVQGGSEPGLANVTGAKAPAPANTRLP